MSEYEQLETKSGVRILVLPTELVSGTQRGAIALVAQADIVIDENGLVLKSKAGAA
jgi:hypothetical protein